MNFTYTFEKPPDGEWGSKFPNNSWSGLVGMLINKEIDIGIPKFHSNKKAIYTNCIFFSYH